MTMVISRGAKCAKWGTSTWLLGLLRMLKREVVRHTGLGMICVTMEDLL